MNESYESWKFLIEFFNSDKSIVDIINKALALKSDKRVRNTSVEDFLSDIRNLLPNGNQETAYKDFLYFVTSKDILKKIEKDEDLEISENRFLGIDMAIGPYFALFALNIYTEWFLYDKEYIEKWKDDNNFDMSRISDYFFKAKGEKALLYPLMILLIVLRREYNGSLKDIYTKRKVEILKTTSKPLFSVIYSIYNQFDFANTDIKEEIKKDINESHIKLTTFHPLIINNIISDSDRYFWLFDELNNQDEKKEQYEWVEEKLKKLDSVKKNSKRLLVDYLCLYTKIRENDYFIIDDTKPLYLINKIYISLNKGKEYKNVCFKYQADWSNIPDESFDYIQILPTPKSPKENYREEYRVDSLRNKLKKDGEFLVVQTEDEYKREQILKEEFSNFRHDLGPVLNDYAIKKLKEELNLAVNNIKKLTTSNFNTSILELQEKLTKCQEKIDKIAYTYHIVSSYIQAAGQPSIRKGNKDKIYFKNFLEDFVKQESTSDKRYILSLDNTILQGNEIIKYFKWTLIVILKTIIDNAVKHGFCDEFKCEKPEIRIIVEESKENYILRICNNGKPININTAEYTTYGFFKGITGHTGLGGYQIYRYAKMHGGDVEVHSSKDWKTEIHLIIKK
jgi:two-component sensor histidine kinase